MELKSGKVNMVIDGQFGSTGKGLFCAYIANRHHIDISISNAAPNAGHTFYDQGKKIVSKHIPVSGIIQKRNTIYLCAGAIINPKILLKEISDFGISSDRIVIHPRTAVIQDFHISEEGKGSAAEKLASTQNGVGRALASKINRETSLAQDIPELKRYVGNMDLMWILDQGATSLMEVPQGLGLSINSGFAYPFCTSREISVSQALSDCQVHPSYLGTVSVCLRTFPIRVGNLFSKNKMVGYSGPFYPDSREMTWEEIGAEPEYTTNTNRIRRIATFSEIQYSFMKRILKPDFIFVNFMNYLNLRDQKRFLNKHPEITHIGIGPYDQDVFQI